MISRIDEVKLRLWEEIIGICTNISIEPKTITLHLLVQNRQSRVVFNLESKEGKLIRYIKKKAVGKRIGILRTDNPDKPIAVRIIDKNGAGSAHNGFD